ncbi:LLM class flavin-dependent oxidoreductase [Arthrobacter sp. BE255]|uniref:LLM class flavin-dependent oxidoreductase n=1 Tax=Arthrobacter sp. BE255 TaxID=2817721 RepID=UPI00285F07D3|nr:LLM class flavin-dependent oxidoreductase [Arthrobacter sp. BE255]MDR7161081.1 alkanesulfonate monooxygenase SsuD/methylene tetrahydromethanopterin reductase-like flavin-dependent oxidoreductase (luciferase family) [Arthrobacter sp. BE255]
MPKPPVVPLSVLDLSPIPAGKTAADALRNSIELAVSAEALGYKRFWLAEHHLSPGVAGAAPHVLSALVAAATSTIRVGTAATILGNYRPVQVAENVGTVAALYPGRIDLGFGRSGVPKPEDPAAAGGPSAASGSAELAAAAQSATAGSTTAQSAPGGSATGAGNRNLDGLVIPPPRPLFGKAFPERFRLQAELLGRVPGDADNFESDVQDVIAFFSGQYRGPEGESVAVRPAQGHSPQFWIHGSSAGPSARLAGKLGLPYGANYHVAPSAVLESVAEYRAHFEPSESLGQALRGGVRRRPGGSHSRRGRSPRRRLRSLGA